MARVLLAFAASLCLGAPARAEPEPLRPTTAPLESSLRPLHECPLDCAADGACCECPRAWARVEALGWWVQGMRTPPLVTTTGPPPIVLVGSERLTDAGRFGLRVEGGAWLGEGCDLGVQGSYFFLAPDNTRDTFPTLTSRPVVRPFVDARTGQPSAELVPGSVTVSASTTLTGADALLRTALCCGRTCDGSYRVDLLGGYRYFGLNDQLTVREDLVVTTAPFVPGTRITVLDTFRTENDFHGASLGAAFVGRRGPFTAEVTARLDFGQMTRRASIFGATRNTVPGLASVVRPGGLLAQTSNIGTYPSSSFAVVPEVDLRLGYRVTERCVVTVGYSFALLTDVARAGDQIDLVTNTNLLPGAPALAGGTVRPAFALRRTDAWLQGVSLGLAFMW